MSRFGQALQQIAPIDANQGGVLRILDRVLYSIVPITVAGLSPQGDTTFRFFRDNANPFVTNIKQPGKLTQTGQVTVMGMGFDIRVIGADSGESLASALPLATAEAKRKYLETGAILARLNAIEIIEDYGLISYPRGGGIHFEGAMAADDLAAPTNQIALHCNNGIPHAMNKRFFTVPFDALPQDTFELDVRFQSAIALPANTTGELHAFLWAIEKKPGVTN